MSTYKPDRWTVLKIVTEEETLYKVFGSWGGGYLDGDSWRMNSGITHVVEDEDAFRFHGSSGSVYICGKHGYGTTGYGAGILGSILDRSEEVYGMEATLLEKDTNWNEIDYGEESETGQDSNE